MVVFLRGGADTRTLKKESKVKLDQHKKFDVNS